MTKSEQQDRPQCVHEAARLLPWFVTGTLTAEESARIQNHLKECAVCAADERREQRMQELICSGTPVEYTPQSGLQKLMARIDEQERRQSAGLEGSQQAVTLRRPVYVRWLVAAVVVQAIGLGVSGALLWDRTGSRLHAPRFTTLSSPASQPSDAPQIRAVFAPEMTVEEMDALLDSISASVAAGPSQAGVYTLALPRQSLDAALARLRSNSKVTFAEGS